MSNVELDVPGRVLGLIESTLKVPADQVDVDANFESFGMNSLIVMELMENIEKELDVTLTPAQFSGVDTVRGLTELLVRLVEKNGGGEAPQAASQTPDPIANPLRSRSTEGTSPAVIDYVRRKYAVDLSSRNLGSLENIVGALVSDHSDALMQYYGLGNQASGTYAAPVKAAEIVIVGMSCRLPDAPDHRAFWANLMAQKNSMREIPKSRWNWEDYFSETNTPGKTISKWGALIDDVDCFDADFFNIPSEEADALDPQLRLLLEETYRAVEDAGMDIKKLAGSRTGVFIGYEYCEYEHHLRKLNNKDFTKGPLFSSSSPSYYLSNRVSFIYDLRGPSESINVNCGSSAIAINRAYYSLLNGESDLAIAGAASLNLFADDYIATSQYGVLSPDGSCGVFDDDANGFTRGEGVASIVLKRRADAERDNNTIYGIIRSCHQNYRGAARNMSEVKHDSISNVLSECYEKASVDLESISYVEVDGYASKWADSFEYEGIKGVFEKSTLKEKHCALGSVKGNIGNVESVSGVTNVIKLALSLHHKKFPATISKKKINTFIDIDSQSHPLYIADKEISFDDIRKDANTPIRAGVNSFADSGSNVHILLEEYMAAKPAANTSHPTRLFVLSAKNNQRLENYVLQYIDFLATADTSGSFADLAYTSQVGRQAMNNRLAIVASTREELIEKLTLIKKSGIREKLGLESKGVFHGRANPGEKNPLAALITADMVQAQLSQSTRAADWKQVAMLWVNGITIPWETIWQRNEAQRVSLPSYPFAKDRHWLDIEFQGVGGNYVVAKSEKIDPPVETSTTEGQAQPVSATTAAPEWHFFIPIDASVGLADAVAMSGAEKLELFLKQAIAELQQKAIDDIATDKDFIQLGMNSIDVAEIIVKTDKLLNVNLSPSVIFKYPEIGSLSRYLAETYGEVVGQVLASKSKPAIGTVKDLSASGPAPEQRAMTPEDILIPLRAQGDRPAIFAVPGAGGSALSMQQLSHELGNAQPFYCLEALGLDGRTKLMGSVEEVADFNIKAIKTVQPSGPYRLLGYSNGGVIAFEMARKLLAEKAGSASLILLDSLCPLLPGKDPTEEMAQVFTHFISSLGSEAALDVEKLRQIPDNQRSEYLHGVIAGLGHEIPKEQFIATFNAATASEQICLAYKPSSIAEKMDVTLFRAAEGFPGAPDDYGWNQLLRQPIRKLDIEANHFSMLDKGPVKEVAKNIAALPTKGAKKSST